MDELVALTLVPIFSTMDTTEIAGLRAIMDRATYEPGEVIVALGEPGDAFFVVIAGHVQFTVEDADGNEIVVDEVGPSGFFGELAMITGSPRAARGKAIDHVVTLALDRDEFFTFLQQHTHAAIDVLTVLSQRLQHTDQLLRRSVSRNVNEIADDQITLGQRIADTVAATMGSWRFIIIQSTLLIAWITLNIVAWFSHWDPYPFILLNLALSFQAAYAAPFIMMSQNRQSAKDRLSAEIDHQVNSKAEVEVGLVLRRLDALERTLHQYQVELRGTRKGTEG
ncbi:MAG: DUF1003 domain-containing protein [Chloroflexales bacterium]